MNSLSKNAFFNAIYRLLNILFPLITSIYVSRVLFAEGVGVVSDVNNNVSYFVLLASLGITAYGIREIAKRSSEKERVDELFSELFLINLLLTLFSLSVFVVGLCVIPAFKENFWLYLIFGLLIVFNILNIDWLFQGLQQYKYIAIRGCIIKVIALASLFVFVRGREDIYAFASITVFATVGNHVLNIIQARRFARFRFKNIHLKVHLKPLLFLALCTISTELYARLDMTMLGAMCSKNTVAFYSYAHTAVNLIVALNTALTAVILPRLSVFAESNKEEFDRLLRIGLNSMLLISIPSFVGLIAVAKPLVFCWLGDGFAETSTALMILSVMIPLKSVGDIICYQVMISYKKEKILMFSYFLTLVINFVCNLLLIPRLGVVGACIASVISEVAVFVFVLLFSSKYIAKKAVDFKNLLLVIISSVLFFGCIALFNHFVANKWICLFADLAIGVLLFLVTNNVFKNKVFLSLLESITKRKQRPNTK